MAEDRMLKNRPEHITTVDFAEVSQKNKAAPLEPDI